MAALSIVLAQTLPSRPPQFPVTRLDGVAGVVPAQTPLPSAGPGVLSPLPVTQLDDPARAALDGAASVSLSISRPMPLREMLHLLVSGTSLSLVLAEDVDGSFEGSLKGLTMRQALEAVLFPRALDYDVRGTLIRVFPRRPKTRFFDVNYLNVRRAWQRGVRSAVGMSADEGTASASSLDNDALAEIERGVQALVSGSGRVHVDRRAGLVQVTDFSDRLDLVALYVEAAEIRSARQVRIEARVFEITLNDAAASTIDWRAAIARSGSAARMDRAAAGIRVSDFDVLMRAIGEQGTVRTIAAPQIVAMNNEPAVMRVGSQEVYFVAASQIDATGRDHRPAAVLDGLTLTVTAQIAADGIVQLNVAPSFAEKIGDARSPGGGSVPVLSVTEADTNVRLQDGETVVISGLLQDRERTRTGAGLAGFFGAQARETVKAELVILLTPTVVTPGRRMPAGSR
jgi:MSHA biogenesis protein MshL